MFDIGATELLILAIVAIIVVGPKDLPKLLRQIGHIVSYGKKITSDLKGQIHEAVEETGVKDIQNSVQEATNLDGKLMEDIEDEFFSDDAFGGVDNEMDKALETEPQVVTQKEDDAKKVSPKTAKKRSGQKTQRKATAKKNATKKPRTSAKV